MNQVFLMGYLEREPDQQTSDNGKLYTQFGVTVEDIQQDGKVFKSFYRVHAYGKTGDVASGLRVGDTVFVEGKLYNRKRTKDGKNYYDMAIMARGVKPVNAAAPKQSEQGNWTANKPVDDDSIPF